MTADNSRFASVGGDKQVFLWDVEQGGTVRRWTGHQARVEAVQFAGEGDWVVVSGEYGFFFSLSPLLSSLKMASWRLFFREGCAPRCTLQRQGFNKTSLHV